MSASDSPNSCVPAHVAIIMDGNGRWAQARGYPRNVGHVQGARKVREISRVAVNMGIRYLTLYAFSSENWRRPQGEVDTLMKLIERFLRRQLKEIREQQLRFRAIGDLTALPGSMQKLIAETMAETASNTRCHFTLALNYGARQELVQAMRQYAKDVQAGRADPDELNWDTISKRLYTADLPDPDLIIRTSGECRVSNFLLLQGAYSEYYFCRKNWPEFSKADLQDAIAAYNMRERRFGMTGEQVQPSSSSESTLHPNSLRA